VSETTEAPAPERRGHGSCGVPIPADNDTTSTVIGPDGALRASSLGASWAGEVQARLAGLLARLRAQGPIRVRFG
jgi:hypothetical protein